MPPAGRPFGSSAAEPGAGMTPHGQRRIERRDAEPRGELTDAREERILDALAEDGRAKEPGSEDDRDEPVTVEGGSEE